MKLIKHFFIILMFLLVFLSIKNYSFSDDVDCDAFINNSTETSSVINETDLNLNSRSSIVLDRSSKKVLYGKNENNRVKMASTTKIMTSIIVIENCDLNQTVIISKNAAKTGGSRVGLKVNDKITVHDLLYGLMLCSGNDAAVALAEFCSGSISNFSELMNQKAKELGLINSHFESPHGLDSDNHYTTAYELAILSDYALKNEIFFNIVGTKNYQITINGFPKNLSNTNELLGNFPGIYGIKTGFTNGANRCIVTACRRDKMDIICVVLGCDTKNFRTQDSKKLINYIFQNFEYIDISKKANEEFEIWKQNNSNNIYVYKGISSNLKLKPSNMDNTFIPVKKKDISNINTYINISNNLRAPIYKNQVVGKLNIVSNNSSIFTLDILSDSNIEKKNLKYYFYNILKSYNKYLIFTP